MTRSGLIGLLFVASCAAPQRPASGEPEPRGWLPLTLTVEGAPAGARIGLSTRVECVGDGVMRDRTVVRAGADGRLVHRARVPRCSRPFSPEVEVTIVPPWLDCDVAVARAQSGSAGLLAGAVLGCE